MKKYLILAIFLLSPSYLKFPVYAADYVKPARLYVSSQLNTTQWGMNNLVDDNAATSWSSQQLSVATANEWLSFDFDRPIHLSKITLVPRFFNGVIQAFPKDFNLSYSDDGTTWHILPGTEFINYQTPAVVDGKASNISLPVNATHRFFGVGFTKAGTDSYGSYFFQLAEVRFISSECQSDNQCDSGQTCRQGTCGVNTLPYWNLKPGNYWIMRGTDVYGNSSLSFRQRYDLELPKQMCADAATRNMLTWRITRDVACPSPHQCYWGNMRFMFIDPTSDPSPYVWAGVDKRYDRDPNNPFVNIGSLYQHSYFHGWQDATHPYVPPYLYTPKFLPDNGKMLEYRYRQNYYWNLGKSGKPIQDDNLCHDLSLGKSQADLIMRYEMVKLQTPAYQGPALLVSQGEKASWCTREDWYLIPNIGIGKVDQWNCNTSGASCYDGQHFGSCVCNAFTDEPGNHPNCYSNKALKMPAMTMSLEKYYLGAALQVTVNEKSSVQLQPGQQFTLKFRDPTTTFTYEGLLETDSAFIDPEGSRIIAAGFWDRWVDTSGKVTIATSPSIPPGTYQVRFRPRLFGPPQDALKNSIETVTSGNTLPWSNTVTVTIVSPSSPTPTPLDGDLNGDGEVNIFDYSILIAFFRKTGTAGFTPADIDKSGKVDIFDYNILVRNFGKSQ